MRCCRMICPQASSMPTVVVYTYEMLSYDLSPGVQYAYSGGVHICDVVV